MVRREARSIAECLKWHEGYILLTLSLGISMKMFSLPRHYTKPFYASASIRTAICLGTVLCACIDKFSPREVEILQSGHAWKPTTNDQHGFTVKAVVRESADGVI